MMSKIVHEDIELKPYQINTEALLGEVLAKHPFGVFGAIKEHIDNAIDAGSSEIDITFEGKTRKVYIGNKSEKCYREADIEQLFHRRHHGKISQNDYGRTILLGFADPQVITIETYLCDGKKVLDTYELTPRGWRLSKVETIKEAPEYTTVVSATLRKDVDFDLNEFTTFVNTVYNLHLYRKTVKISVNGTQLAPIVPQGEPKTREFEFGGKKFKSFMWQRPQWKEGKIYQSMTSKGTGDGAFICSKNTLVTYAPFYRSHMGEEHSYFLLINDEEGYFAEDALDLGKLQLMFIPKVSRFYRYIKENILPREKAKPSDIITEGNMFLKDFFGVGIGSYEPKEPQPKEGGAEEKTEEGKEGGKEEKEKKEKEPNVTTEHRNTGLPELQLRTIKEFATVPFVDIINPKLLALNDGDPLFDKSWMKNEMREVYLIRLVPFLDARKAYRPEEVADARKQWVTQDAFMRKLLHAKPVKEEAPKQPRAAKTKAQPIATTAPTLESLEKESDALYDQLFGLDEKRRSKEIKEEDYLTQTEEIRKKIIELQGKRQALKTPKVEEKPAVEPLVAAKKAEPAKPAAKKNVGRPRTPEKPQDEVKAIDEARKAVDAQIAKMKPIKTWELPTRLDKTTGKQKIITMGLYKVNGKNVRRPVETREVSGDQVRKNLTKPTKEAAIAA